MTGSQASEGWLEEPESSTEPPHLLSPPAGPSAPATASSPPLDPADGAARREADIHWGFLRPGSTEACNGWHGKYSSRLQLSQMQEIQANLQEGVMGLPNA